MKKILLLLSLVLLLYIGAVSQTLSTTTTQPAVGPVELPIDVTNIGTMYTLTVYYQFDNSVLSYTGFTNAADPGLVVSQQTANILKIVVGTFPVQTTIADGKLVDLQFDYSGGYSDLVFGINTSTYKSSILTLGFSQEFFESSDVTNGAVQGYYDNTISGGDWNTAGSWSASKVPNAWANVTVAPGTETTIGAAAVANNLTIAQGGQLTSNSTLNVAGDFLIESNASGSGSFINNGTLTGTTDVTVENYLTTGNYHGISMPVSGETSSAFMGAPSAVYLKTYAEATNTYTNIVDYGVALNPSQGYMIKVESGGSYTPGYTGALNASGSYTTTKNGLGFNFVGNPFTSAIDWNGSGWTKTNLGATIWVYNNGNWATWNGTVGTNDGTQYVAMNQGFFVQANAAGSLSMTTATCVHDTVPFMKGQTTMDLVRLQVEANGLVDESVVLFIDGATVDYDGDFDSHKLFSFNPDYPQLYSTANDLMAINALPVDYREAIPMDVRGANGNMMTISATETAGFDKLYLKDEAAGTIVNLVEESYTFSYNADVTDRFTLFFSITDVEENTLSSNAKVFAYDNTIQVVVTGIESADVTVFNLLGQAVDSRRTSGTVTRIPVKKSGYYLVKVSNGSQVSTQKVFIK